MDAVSSREDGDVHAVVHDEEGAAGGLVDRLTEGAAAGEKPEHHHDVVVEIGGKANPPGFDDNLRGLEQGGQKTFTVHYPDDYTVKEMAGTSVEYSVTVKDLRKRVLPALDDEFAKDVGEFDTLVAIVLLALTKETYCRASR